MTLQIWIPTTNVEVIDVILTVSLNWVKGILTLGVPDCSVV